MTTSNHRINRKKQGPALIVAFGMTALIAIVMLGLGVNALFGGQVTNAQAAAPVVESVDLSGLSADELRALVEQYQAREIQFQAELTQAADQLNQANTRIAEYESFANQLQQAGVIQISANGQVSVFSPFGNIQNRDSHDGFGDDD